MNQTTQAPNDRAIDLARELFRTTRYTERSACEAALRAVPACKWSPDQLKARAFNPDCKNMFYTFGRAASTLAVFAWLIGSTVQGNDRTCRYRDYTGRVYSVVQPAASTCASRIEVPSC